MKVFIEYNINTDWAKYLNALLMITQKQANMAYKFSLSLPQSLISGDPILKHLTIIP